MKHYASKEDTIKALQSLGFIQPPQSNGKSSVFLDSPKRDEKNRPVVQAYVYQSKNNYWCVDLEGSFRAPCIWNDPHSKSSKTDTLSEFASFLDEHFPGWC